MIWVYQTTPTLHTLQHLEGKTIHVYDEGLRPGNRDIECYFISVLLQMLLLIVMCVVYMLTLLSFH